MDKQKQVEEMAKLICDKSIEYQGERKTHIHGVFGAIAEKLYNAGCRKIPENAVVLTMENLADMKFTQEHCDLYMENKWLKECIPLARKETAEKFAERLKDLVAERNCNEDYDWEDVQIDGQIFVECVDETCKEITEGKT